MYTNRIMRWSSQPFFATFLVWRNLWCQLYKVWPIAEVYKIGTNCHYTTSRAHLHSNVICASSQGTGSSCHHCLSVSSPSPIPFLSFPLLSGEENDLTFTTDQINGQSCKGQQWEKVLDSLASRHGKISEHITTVG